MSVRHDKATCVESDECVSTWHYWRCPKHDDYGNPINHDKATGGRTGAAAVDQAIAGLEKALRWMAEYRMTGTEQTLHIDFQGKAIELLPALRVLADAVEEFQANSKFVQELEFENVRLARQVADLEAALRKAKDTALAFKSMGAEGSGWVVGHVDAALAAARSRDPQEPTHDPSATPFSRPALQSNEAGLFGHDHIHGGDATRDPQEGA